ncbi:hypothetical protein [Spirosoma pomorum]|jgi:hypothetical protein
MTYGKNFVSGRQWFWLIVYVLPICLTSSACAQKQIPQKVSETSVVQGVCGIVIVKRGNQMPGPDASPRKGEPVERDVLIYPLLNMNQVQSNESGFITSVGGKQPVKTVRSGKDGRFCISLPVGQYSLLVKEPGGLYANLSDSQNNIFPVTIQKNRQVTVGVTISHQATF